jgi:hypothetical protein
MTKKVPITAAAAGIGAVVSVRAKAAFAVLQFAALTRTKANDWPRKIVYGSSPNHCAVVTFTVNGVYVAYEFNNTENESLSSERGVS